MDRRLFISSVACGGVVVALAATAQTPPRPNRPRRVAWLQGGPPDPPDEQKQVADALAEVGWIVGKSVLIDWRFVGFEDLTRAAEDVVNAKVDLIIASGTPATLAAKNATTTIPILMWSAADPVGSGLVASLARPGGNVTGMAMLSPEQSSKRLSLLRELLPEMRRVGKLVYSANPGLHAERKQFEEACRSLGMEPIFIDTARFAVSLPTIVDDSQHLEAGALLAYELDQIEFIRRDAALFDKLLRGTKPAEIPVEQPTRFNLGINLRTAKALRIPIPQTLLLRADRLIR